MLKDLIVKRLVLIKTWRGEEIVIWRRLLVITSMSIWSQPKRKKLRFFCEKLIFLLHYFYDGKQNFQIIGRTSLKK